TTPQNTYQDEALTTPHANPVVADSNGLFAPIYLDPRLPSYRVKFTTSANVLVYQVDNVPSNQNAVTTLRVESTVPSILLYDTDGTSGQRKYRISVAGNTFKIDLMNDAESVATQIFSYSIAGSPSSFTGTLSGMTGAVTGTFKYRVLGNVVTLWIDSNVTGTSNAAGMNLTGMPSEILP